MLERVVWYLSLRLRPWRLVNLALTVSTLCGGPPLVNGVYSEDSCALHCRGTPGAVVHGYVPPSVVLGTMREMALAVTPGGVVPGWPTN